MKLRTLLRLAGLVAVYLVIAIPFRTLNLIPGFTDVRPVTAIGPVYAVFYGPVGCLASGLGNLLADVLADSLRWTSIAGFAVNFLGPLLVWLYWTRLSRTPFALRTPLELLRHSLLLTLVSLFETAILAPSVALVYPEVDALFFGQTVFFNNAVFPIVLGIPLSILLQEEFGFRPRTSQSQSTRVREER